MRMNRNIVLVAMVGVMCVALMGCGGSEPAPEEQSAEQYLEQLEDEVQTMIEEEESQHEAELEAQYPEGILPAGSYRVTDRENEYFLSGFVSQYNSETGEGIITGIGSQDGFKTITDEYRGGNSDSYRYDPETGLYHFELYYWSHSNGQSFGNVLLLTFEGYYVAEDDTFVMTYFYSEEMGCFSEEGYERVYQRE